MLPALAVGQVSFFPNAGFERIDPDHPSLPLGLPAHMAKAPYTSVFSGTESAAHQGQRSLAFSLEGEGRGFTLPVSGLESGRLYRVSCFYRTRTEASETNVIRVSAWLGSSPEHAYYPTAARWCSAQQVFRASSGSAAMGLYFSAYRNGNPRYSKTEPGILLNPITLSGWIDDVNGSEVMEHDIGEDNLVQNGGFEQEARTAPGWSGGVIDERAPFSGQRCARMTFREQLKNAYLTSGRMPFQAGAIYEISFAVKTSAYVPLRLRLLVPYRKRDDDGVRPHRVWRQIYSPEQTGPAWRRYSYVIEMPQKGINKQLYLPGWGYNRDYFGDAFVGRMSFRFYPPEGGCTYWIDDCRVRRIVGPPLFPPEP